MKKVAKWSAALLVGAALMWVQQTYIEPNARGYFPDSMSRVDSREAAAEKNLIIIDLRTPKEPGLDI
jgi:hypothetical protein